MKRAEKLRTYSSNILVICVENQSNFIENLLVENNNFIFCWFFFVLLRSNVIFVLAIGFVFGILEISVTIQAH